MVRPQISAFARVMTGRDGGLGEHIILDNDGQSNVTDEDDGGDGVGQSDEDVESPFEVDVEDEILPIVKSERQHICSDDHSRPPPKGKVMIISL
ncbi:hypothetical protein FRX31_034517 [Thalictrum thalictroides]|uniref:Uncharacterized protein n=1 Tax=Thalictrum thalictroides TaxID=46969 RepID=A0A7J6UUG9_THATH|nr:hypothetical protein FRX31_034517 [Thalictrum thalictroides]